MAEKRTGGHRLRIALFAGVWTAVAGAIWLAMPGCYGRNCDLSFVTYGANPGEGHMLDAITWESNPIEGGWLPLPGNRTWVFQPPQVYNHRTTVIPFVSGSAAPLDAGANYTVGSGNIAVVVPFPDGTFWIANTTCADYFLRVEVQIRPNPDLDAGDGGDAGDAGDASDDAGLDAGVTDAAARD